MRFLLLFMLLFQPLRGSFSPPPQLDLARITSPKAGDALQGNVEILGTVTGIGFQYAEINFQSQSGTQNTWFLITMINQVVVDDVLTIWDTTNIADGTYAIRVIAYYEDGHTVESIVENLRIRNYTAIETSEVEVEADNSSLQTPTLEIFTATPQRATPTDLPPNELALEEKDFVKAASLGGLFGITGLIVIGFLLLIRKRKHG